MNPKELILELLFPPLCFGCRRYHKNYLCENCWQKIPINTSFFCPTCQNRIIHFPSLRAQHHSPMASGAGRGNLITTRPPCHPVIQYLLAPATEYQNEAVKNLIHELKFNRIASAMEPIKKILDEYLSNIIAPPNSIGRASPLWGGSMRGNPCGEQSRTINNFLVVPIPISNARLRERGFNQAELIADHIAQRLNLPMLKSVILKSQNNKKQSELKNWEERKENVKNCFSLAQPESIKGQNIILVDDVFTSGATISEAVNVLKSAGARKIIAFTLARAR